MYEIIRTIYNTPGTDGSEGARIGVLQQTLSQLRLTNIATLDACMNHFTRLIDLTSADEQYVAALATSLASCILRPRSETSLTMEEKHAYRLIRDLFQHKDAIFSELKRMSTLSHSSSVTSNNRPRAISTDESNRRAHMEERQRALLEKVGGTGRSRATSPAPSPRHRRDRSVGGPETRFPIQTSPTSANDRHRSSMASLAGGVKRSSLEVPDSDGTAPAPSSAAEVNGAYGEAKADSETPTVEKRNSLGRSSARFERGRRVTLDRAPAAGAPTEPIEEKPTEDEASTATHSVTLVDRPMDD